MLGWLSTGIGGGLGRRRSPSRPASPDGLVGLGDRLRWGRVVVAHSRFEILPVRLSLDDEIVGSVDESVDGRLREEDILEGSDPLVRVAVACDDRSRATGPLDEELIDVTTLVSAHGLESKVVQDEQVDGDELCHHALARVVEATLPKSAKYVVGAGEDHPRRKDTEDRGRGKIFPPPTQLITGTVEEVDMPREARPVTPYVPHHIISRFVNREFRMRSNVERAQYLKHVGRIAPRTTARLNTYGLMSSHVHWAMTGAHDPLGQLLHPLHTGFGLWWNRRYGGLGQVFAERPCSILIEREEALARLVAYIHNNPVRAGLVVDPINSDWTGHRAYVGEDSAPEWLEIEWTLAAMGYSSSRSGRLAFHEYVRSRSHLGRDPQLAGPGRLGSGDLRRLQYAVSEALGVEPELVTAPVKRGDCSDARQVFFYAARVLLGASGVLMAGELKVSPATISRSLRRMRSRKPPSPDVLNRVMDVFLRLDDLKPAA